MNSLYLCNRYYTESIYIHVNALEHNGSLSNMIGQYIVENSGKLVSSNLKSKIAFVCVCFFELSYICIW